MATHRGHANLVQMDGETFAADLFTYPVSFGSVASTKQSSPTIQIQADSYFEWFKSTWSGNKNGAAEPWPDNIDGAFTLQITDTGTGVQLFNQPMVISGIAGTGREPFILPQPRLFNPNSAVTFALTSFSGSTWDNLYFNMIGRKLFKLSGSGGGAGHHHLQHHAGGHHHG